MRPMIETLDRLRPCDQFQLDRYHLTTHQAATAHLIGKRLLVEHARDIGNSHLELDVADPNGSLASGTTITVWAGATADQWWYEGGVRRGTWRGPLAPSDLAG